MKLKTRMRDVLNKHSRGPKDFSAMTGIPRSTCEKISSGKPTNHDKTALFVDYCLTHGKDIDALKKMRIELKEMK